jgi:ribosomal protein S18 acetylase RimI-like enzyme
MLIREAKGADLPEIIKLECKCYEEMTKFDALLKPLDEVKGRIERYIEKKFKAKNSKFFVATDANKLVGFAFADIPRKHFWKVRFGYLDSLFVLPGWRRRGIGKKLVQKLVSWLKSKGIEYVQLDVDAHNIPALKMYEKLGFQDRAKRLRKRIKPNTLTP